jgi:hypothetical protein
MIRRQALAIENGGGEQTEIGRIRKVGWHAANFAERFDPAGSKSPKGERRREAQQAKLAVKAATGQMR